MIEEGGEREMGEQWCGCSLPFIFKVLILTLHLYINKQNCFKEQISRKVCGISTNSLKYREGWSGNVPSSHLFL